MVLFESLVRSTCKRVSPVLSGSPFKGLSARISWKWRVSFWAFWVYSLYFIFFSDPSFHFVLSLFLSLSQRLWAQLRGHFAWKSHDCLPVLANDSDHKLMSWWSILIFYLKKKNEKEFFLDFVFGLCKMIGVKSFLFILNVSPSKRNFPQAERTKREDVGLWEAGNRIGLLEDGVRQSTGWWNDSDFPLKNARNIYYNKCVVRAAYPSLMIFPLITTNRSSMWILRKRWLLPGLGLASSYRIPEGLVTRKPSPTSALATVRKPLSSCRVVGDSFIYFLKGKSLWESLLIFSCANRPILRLQVLYYPMTHFEVMVYFAFPLESETLEMLWSFYTFRGCLILFDCFISSYFF